MVHLVTRDVTCLDIRQMQLKVAVSDKRYIERIATLEKMLSPQVEGKFTEMNVCAKLWTHSYFSLYTLESIVTFMVISYQILDPIWMIEEGNQFKKL